MFVLVDLGWLRHTVILLQQSVARDLPLKRSSKLRFGVPYFANDLELTHSLGPCEVQSL